MTTLPQPTARMLDEGFAGGAGVREVHRLALACFGPARDASAGAVAALAAAARELSDQAYAALHTGPWREVDLVWREAYMFAALHLAQAGRPAACRDAALGLVRTLDLGLMLGSSAYRAELLALVGSLEADELRAGEAERAESGPWLPEPIPLGAPGATCPSGHPLRVMARPSLEAFLLQCMAPAQPALLTGALEGWPALGARSWRDLGYLKRVAGHRTVPVELGEDYLHPGWSEELQTLSDFIDRHLAPAAMLGAETTSPSRKRARGSGGTPARLGYLAQHALLEQVPALGADVRVPDYCALSTEPASDDDDDEREREQGPARANVWLGPGGTVSPLHHDPEHNLLAQVVGAKYVRLYAPEEGSRLYAHPDGLHKVSSQIRGRIREVDHARYPLFAEARYVDGWLRAGEALYIPPRWWHYVESLQPSCSVSFWWS